MRETGLANRIEALAETIIAPRTDPIYNCHSYLTKVPIGAIQPFIETFTEPGDTVLALTGHPARSFEQFVTDFAQVFGGGS